MAQVTFYYQGVDGATITQTSIGEDADHGLVNLYDRNKNLYWKAANANTAGYLNIDMASAIDANSLVLVSHNYTVVAPSGIGIKLASDDNDDGNYSAVTYHIGSAGSYHKCEAGDLVNWVETFALVQSKRYWRLYLEAMGAATYQQIGFVLLGAKFQHSVNWNFGDGNLGYDYGVETGETTGGHRRRQKNYGLRKSWEYSFEYIDETHKDNFIAFLDGVYGPFYPFFFTDEEGSGYYVSLIDRTQNFTHLNYQEYNPRIRLEEEL